MIDGPTAARPDAGGRFRRRFDNLSERQQWCGQGGEGVYTMTYQSASSSGPLVVVAEPDGEERDWAGRPLVTAARVLADDGCTVVRFDYRGQGESGGTYEETTLASRADDLLAVCAHASAAHRQRPIVLGARLGATIALLAAQRDASLMRLVLWEPITDHAAYINTLLRQNVSAQMVAYGKVHKDRAALIEAARGGSPVNVTGFLLSGPFIDEVLALDDVSFDPDRPILVISAAKLQGPMAALPGATYTRMPCPPFWREPKVHSAAPLLWLDPTLTWLRQEPAPGLREVS